MDIDVLHLPPPSPIKGKVEKYIYIGSLNLVSPYGKTQSSPKLGCAKRTRTIWSHRFLGPRFCWPAPSSIEFQSSKQQASLLTCCSMATSWMKYVFERFFHSLFQTLLPVKADWFVNSMKFKSWPEATYLSWSLPR